MRVKFLEFVWSLEPQPEVNTRAVALQEYCFLIIATGSRELLLPNIASIMSGPEVHHLFHHPIADHSFSADRQTLAVARDNNVELYDRSGSKFTLKDELKGHDKTVTGVDIAPRSGMIVTCSQGG